MQGRSFSTNREQHNGSSKTQFEIWIQRKEIQKLCPSEHQMNKEQLITSPSFASYWPGKGTPFPALTRIRNSSMTIHHHMQQWVVPIWSLSDNQFTTNEHIDFNSSIISRKNPYSKKSTMVNYLLWSLIYIYISYQFYYIMTSYITYSSTS